MSTQTAAMPLDRFPVIRTQDAAHLQAVVAQYYGDVRLSIRSDSDSLQAHCNHCQLNHVGISYARYGAEISHFYADPHDVYAVPIALAGSASGTTRNVSAELTRRQTLISTPGQPFELHASADFEEITTQLDANAVRRTLASLIGAEVNGRLMFDPILDFENPSNLLWRRLLLFLIREAEACEADHPLTAFVEIEQALIVMFLTANRHSFSQVLERRDRDAAPRQVRLAEEYIEAHWNQPITMEHLVRQTNVSARSIFSSFRKSRGYSPMAFAKQVRLRHARQMLLCAGPGTTVAKIAVVCGFGNLGNFAKDYRGAYGELPSDTLRMSATLSP